MINKIILLITPNVTIYFVENGTVLFSPVLLSPVVQIFAIFANRHNWLFVRYERIFFFIYCLYHIFTYCRPVLIQKIVLVVKFLVKNMVTLNITNDKKMELRTSVKSNRKTGNFK